MKKTILHRIALASVLVSLATPLAACEDDDPLAPADPDSTIVETAIAAGSFETLVAAIQAAGLVEALSGEGPFTVFAPTEAAFAALPTGRSSPSSSRRTGRSSRRSSRTTWWPGG